MPVPTNENHSTSVGDGTHWRARASCFRRIALARCLAIPSPEVLRVAPCEGVPIPNYTTTDPGAMLIQAATHRTVSVLACDGMKYIVAPVSWMRIGEVEEEG